MGKIKGWKRDDRAFLLPEAYYDDADTQAWESEAYIARGTAAIPKSTIAIYRGTSLDKKWKGWLVGHYGIKASRVKTRGFKTKQEALEYAYAYMRRNPNG